MNIVTFSLKNLRRRKMRSALAILGIILGVMLITSLLTIMDGLESSITESLELLSGNLIIQQENSPDQTDSRVNLSLVENLSSNPDIEAISPEIYVTRILPDGGGGGFGGRSINLIGINNSYREIVSPEYIKTGTYFDESESGKAILGSKLAELLEKGVGDNFTIPPKNFTITGIFETNTLVDLFMALIPLDDARAISDMAADKVSIIEVKPAAPERADAIREYVESNFEGYEVVFPEELMQEASEVLDVIRNAVWVVSSIAVLIGSIGIANAMLMSVMERTPEIGLLKATGWKNSDVGYSVLIEALGIGIVGGLIGLLFGVVAAQMAQNLIPALSVRLTLITIVESLGFALGLSLLSGVYPAVKAARVSPIRAIRGE